MSQKPACDVKSIKMLRGYLCERCKGRQKDLAQVCLNCESRCEYGKRMTDLLGVEYERQRDDVSRMIAELFKPCGWRESQVLHKYRQYGDLA